MAKNPIRRVLIGLAMVAVGFGGIAHDARNAPRIEPPAAIDAPTAPPAEPTQPELPVAPLPPDPVDTPAETIAEEPESLGLPITRETFHTIPLGITERELREFMGSAPDTETTDDESDLWLHWGGYGESQINVFINDDVVTGTNYWADSAAGVVSYAQFIEVEKLTDLGALFRSGELTAVATHLLIQMGPAELVAEQIPFEPVRERRIFDSGDEILFLDFPGWGNRVVTFGFINGSLTTADADVVEADDQVLVRVR